MCYPSGPPGFPDDDCPSEREAEITKELPQLFEAMNSASSQINIFECKANDAKKRQNQFQEQWKSLYTDFCAQHGAAVDCAKPYFDTAHALDLASRRIQCASHKVSMADSQYTQAKTKLCTVNDSLDYGAHEISLDADQQDNLSRATVEVLNCQREIDRCRKEYARALDEYKEIKESFDSWRAQVGDFTIRRLEPCFKQLQQYQLAISAEQLQITIFTKHANAAKKVYDTTLRKLEHINTVCHQMRRERAETLMTILIFGDEECVPQHKCVEAGVEPLPFEGLCKEACKAIPEVAPEFGVFAAMQTEFAFS